ncbi:MAG: DUF6326 family protein [Croceivirga sp.]
MKDKKVTPQLLLASLWIFFLFNMLARDMHQFLNPVFLDELMTKNIAEEFVLVFGIILEIPILMIPLSLTLTDRHNKWANCIASGIVVLGILYSLSTADLDDIFFALMELGAVATILKIAFKLSPSTVKKHI